MKRAFWATVGCAALVAVLSPRAYSGEEYKRFLRSLQQQGYGDMAVEYLRQIEKRSDLPKALAETIDLEYSNSLWAAASNAYNDEEALKFREEAQTRLDKFLKEHPNHPAIADAMLTWGDMAYKRGLQLVYGSRGAKESAEKTQAMEDARKAFEEARPRFVKAEERRKVEYEAKKAAHTAAEAKNSRTPSGRSPKTPRRSPVRTPEQIAFEDAEVSWIEARAMVALTDYWTAHTYDETKGKAAREKLLKATAKTFDAMYQQFRSSRSGLVAHLWHAKTLNDLGDTTLAFDLCEEILANAPEPSNRPGAEIDPIFVEAELLYLRLMVKRDEKDDALKEATDWLKANSALQKTEAYQGIALELAKMQIEKIKTLKGQAKKSVEQLVLKMLTDISKIRSEYQQEAILLKREIAKAGGASGPVDPSTTTSFDEALALANVAAENEQWQDALVLFNRALELLPKHKVPPAKKKEFEAEVREKVAVCGYRIAFTQYSAGKLLEAYTAAEKIARENLQTQIAANAAALAAYSASKLYAEVRKDPKADEKAKTEALERLTKIADFTIKNWPQRPESDDARIALAQASIAQNDFDRAIEMFINVNPKSSKYPDAMLFAAQESWRRYRIERNKGEKRDKTGMTKWLADAEKWLKVSVELQEGLASKDKDAQTQLSESRFMLAEVLMEGGKAAESIKLYQPLIDATIESKPEKLDAAGMRLFAGATRAYVAVGDATKAADTAIALAKFVGDEGPANAVLLDAARVLVGEVKEAEAKAITAKAGDNQSEATAATAKLETARKTLGRLLDQMATREQYSLPTQVYLGTQCIRAGKKDVATKMFQRILDRAKNDSSFAGDKDKTRTIIMSIRAQLIGMLREEKRYEEALNQINALLEDKANSKSLDLLMQKGLILQSWSEEDPKHYSAAVSHWTELRGMLDKMKKKPPQFFEVIYYTGECLVFDAQKTKDPLKAQQAETLLRTFMVRYPSLSGPEMIAKYKVLIKKANALQGGKKDG